MPQQYPKDITDAMRDCILAIFWPKKDIISFFENNGCVSSDLRTVRHMESEMNRVQIVDDVFATLHSRTDGGIGPFRAMLQAITQWNHFDPYYFGKLRKLDVGEARRRIAHLLQIQEIRDAKLKAERETAAARAVAAAERAKANSLEDLRNIYLQLFRSDIGHQKRGYEFERFLRELSSQSGLAVTEPFRIDGEQIDGSVKFEGEHYIVEAKWHDKLIASDALYHFAYKVEGKMYGRGFFVSVNGFSTESVEALVKGKTLNTILIDGADLTMVVEGHIPFVNLLDTKVKAAQTSGIIYFDPMSGHSKI